MTINGGKPHAVGDRGQRYEITYFDGRAAERRTLGWCETREQADMIVLTMSSHPVWSAFEIEDRAASALTHEARRYCHGDDAWTDWQPCTAEQAARYEKDDAFKVRPLKTPNAALTGAEGVRVEGTVMRQED